MLSLLPDRAASEGLRVLCLGAHSDDIEIGCGGTLLVLQDAIADLEVDWIVFSASGEREEEARESARTLLSRDGVTLDVRVHGFRDRYFPCECVELKETFDDLKTRVDPDIVFTHHEHDRHQDHRELARLAWNTFRDHVILEYEIVKYDGDLGQPNVFVPLPPDVRERKVTHLLETFPSQSHRHWFDRSTFESLMRIRGVECGAPNGYAEAFHARKLTLGV